MCSSDLIATACAIATFEGFGTGEVGQDGRDTHHVFDEAHVIVPLVVDTEWLNPIRDGVIGKGFEVGFPMRIDGPVEIAKTTHPFEELVPRLSCYRFGGPVNHDHSRARRSEEHTSELQSQA